VVDHRPAVDLIHYLLDEGFTVIDGPSGRTASV
jgi:hypothetical protein